MNKLRPLVLTLGLLAGCATHTRKATQPPPETVATQPPPAPAAVRADSGLPESPRLRLQLELPPRPAVPATRAQGAATGTAGSDTTHQAQHTDTARQAGLGRVLAGLAGAQHDLVGAKRAATRLGGVATASGEGQPLPARADTTRQVCAGVLVSTWLGADGRPYSRCRLVANPAGTRPTVTDTEYLGLLGIFVVTALVIIVFTPNARLRDAQSKEPAT